MPQIAAILARLRPENAGRYRDAGLLVDPPLATENAIATLLSPSYRRTTLCVWTATFFCLFCIFGLSGWLPTVLLQRGLGFAASFGFSALLLIATFVGGLACGYLYWPTWIKTDHDWVLVGVGRGFGVGAGGVAQPPCHSGVHDLLTWAEVTAGSSPRSWKGTPACAALFDLPHALEGGRRTIEQAGLADRCEVASGDFFVSVPEGADLYLLSRVIHDWNDEKAVAILKVVRAAVAPHGRLVLLETMLQPTVPPIYPLLSDLNMLARTGGCERTEAEYRSLYRAAGFELTRATVTTAPTGTTVIEGRPR
jgi:hypothetical protein